MVQYRNRFSTSMQEKAMGVEMGLLRDTKSNIDFGMRALKRKLSTKMSLLAILISVMEVLSKHRLLQA